MQHTIPQRHKRIDSPIKITLVESWNEFNHRASVGAIQMYIVVKELRVTKLIAPAMARRYSVFQAAEIISRERTQDDFDTSSSE